MFFVNELSRVTLYFYCSYNLFVASDNNLCQNSLRLYSEETLLTPPTLNDFRNSYTKKDILYKMLTLYGFIYFCSVSVKYKKCNFKNKFLVINLHSFNKY